MLFFRTSTIWIFWTIVAILAQFPERIALFSKGINHHYAIVFISPWFIWAFLTPYILRLVDRYPIEKKNLFRSGLTQVVFIVSIVVVHIILELPAIYFLDWLFFQTPQEIFDPVLKGYILFSLFIRIFICSFILSIGHGMAYFRKLKQSETETSRLQAQLTASQLESLRIQLQPHFLFNAHQTIVGLMLKNENQTAIAMVTSLSDLLRKSLEKHDNLVPLRQELEIVMLYIKIQQIRFQGRITVVNTILKEFQEAKVPSFILQPLVENAIKHGFEPVSQPGKIELGCTQENAMLVLTILNDGAELKSNYTTGIGISNTKARLQQLYGNDFNFTLERVSDLGTKVSIKIPYQI